MSTRLIVDNDKELKEVRQREFPVQPIGLRVAAQLISWIFHPVFLPLYMVFFMLYLHPYLYAGFDASQKTRTLMMAVLMFTFFPLITVALLKGLHFIESIYLKSQKDRVIPILASMIWYFWLWHVWRNLGKADDNVQMANEAIRFALASFISTILTLMLNIRMKVSLHAIAAGVILGSLLSMAFSEGIHFGIILSIALLLTGIICTARFIVSDHTSAEVYIGLLTGMFSVVLANVFG